MTEITKKKGYLSARADAEEELALIDSETARMTTELTAMAGRRRTVVKMIEVAKEALGEIPPTPVQELDHERDEAGGLTLVARNAFRALGPVQAALKYLRILEHEETHTNLVKALQKGNVKSGSRRPTDSFRNALARRPDVFVWRKEKGKVGVWGLREWQKPGEQAMAAAASSIEESPRPLSLVS